MIINDELESIWKKTAMTYSSIRLEGQREIIKDQNQHIMFRNWDMNSSQVLLARPTFEMLPFHKNEVSLYSGSWMWKKSSVESLGWQYQQT
jgi:hypothetical protein